MRKYWLMVVTLMLGWTLSAQAQKVLEYTYVKNYEIMSNNELKELKTESKKYYRIAVATDYSYVSLYCPSDDLYFKGYVTKSEKSDDGETLYMYVMYEGSTYVFTFNVSGVTNMFFGYNGMTLCKSFIE